MQFAYPRDLIPVIHQRWELGQQRGSVAESERLPPDAAILTALELAYHLSFQTEERRPIRCEIALCNRELVRAQSLPALEAVEFQPARPFTLAEVLQLAPAADPATAMVGVEPVGLPDRPELQIWGLINIGSDWWDFAHGNTSAAIFPPPCLIISVQGAGSVTVSWGGLILVKLRDGQITAPEQHPLHHGPVGHFLDPGAAAFTRAVLESLGQEAWDPEGDDEEYPQRFYRHYLERLAHHIRTQQHGGTILMVPDNLTPDSGGLTQYLSFKYVAPAPGVWELLQRSLILRRRQVDLQAQLGGAAQVPGELYRELENMALELQDLDRALGDSVHFLAALAAVDGALVLTDRYRLVGFGAEVTAPAPDLRTIRIATDSMAQETSTRPIDAFGTRHRSALRFCYHCPQTLAIIVSQDGDVRVARRVREQVVLWPAVSLGEMGV